LFETLFQLRLEFASIEDLLPGQILPLVIRAKTPSLRLSKEQSELCREWIGNHRQLRRLVRRMEQISIKKADRDLGEISLS
jgi:hypothetical protein